jgi:hypothetical protein
MFFVLPSIDIQQVEEIKCSSFLPGSLLLLSMHVKEYFLVPDGFLFGFQRRKEIRPHI